MKKKTILLIHLAFWFYELVLLELFNELAYRHRLPPILNFFNPLSLSQYFIYPLIFYINYFFILPFFYLRRKNYSLLIGSWILLSISYIALRYFIQEYLLLKYFGICNYCDVPSRIFIFHNFFQGVTELILSSTVIWFVIHRISDEKNKITLEKAKLHAEKKFLQSQIAPHFMFNTLNNIYSMVFHQSAQSLPAIQRLADIMRYIASESASDKVTLHTEIKYLNDYIELQKLRSEEAAIDFNVSGNQQSLTICPLLLISFIENAFTHGVINDTSNPVKINISISGNTLLMQVSNKINKSVQYNSSGIGLNNIRQRLELLYPGHFRLDTIENDGIFTSNLAITAL